MSAFPSDLETIKKMADAKAEYGYVGRALHNGYHLGQVVLLRQMADCWPPYSSTLAGAPRRLTCRQAKEEP